MEAQATTPLPHSLATVSGRELLGMLPLCSHIVRFFQAKSLGFYVESPIKILPQKFFKMLGENMYTS